jgi:hypothetical protein
MRIRSALFLVPVLFVALLACNGEGQGQPCDPNAGNGGNDDCQSPLVCTTNPNPYTTGSRCCPADLSQSTTFECCPAGGAAGCTVAGLGPDANPAPPDTGTPDTGSAAEAGKDATVDSPGETDAPAETGPAGDASDGSAADGTAPQDASEAASPADGSSD